MPLAFNQFGEGETLSPQRYREWEILMWKYGMTTSDGTTFREDPTSKPLCGDGILLQWRMLDAVLWETAVHIRGAGLLLLGKPGVFMGS